METEAMSTGPTGPAPGNLGKTGLSDSQHGALQALTSYISFYSPDVEWEMTIDKRAHGWRWRAVQADRLALMPGVLQRGALNRSNHVTVRVPLNVSVHEALTTAEELMLKATVDGQVDQFGQLIVEARENVTDPEKYIAKVEQKVEILASAMTKLGLF